MAGTLHSLLSSNAPNRKLSPQQLRRLWLRAAKLHHPDRGGSLKAMKLVNEAYVNGDSRRLIALITVGLKRKK